MRVDYTPSSPTGSSTPSLVGGTTISSGSGTSPVPRIDGQAPTVRPRAALHRLPSAVVHRAATGEAGAVLSPEQSRAVSDALFFAEVDTAREFNRTQLVNEIDDRVGKTLESLAADGQVRYVTALLDKTGTLESRGISMFRRIAVFTLVQPHVLALRNDVLKAIVDQVISNMRPPHEHVQAMWCLDVLRGSTLPLADRADLLHELMTRSEGEREPRWGPALRAQWEQVKTWIHLKEWRLSEAESLEELDSHELTPEWHLRDLLRPVSRHDNGLAAMPDADKADFLIGVLDQVRGPLDIVECETPQSGRLPLGDGQFVVDGLRELALQLAHDHVIALPHAERVRVVGHVAGHMGGARRFSDTAWCLDLIAATNSRDLGHQVIPKLRAAFSGADWTTTVLDDLETAFGAEHPVFTRSSPAMLDQAATALMDRMCVPNGEGATISLAELKRLLPV